MCNELQEPPASPEVSRAVQSGATSLPATCAYFRLCARSIDNITLASCTINNEPEIAIVMLDESGEGTIAVMRFFVGITRGMKIDFPGERESDAGGSGPKTSREAFDANKVTTTFTSRSGKKKVGNR
jgi:hypothetical protein